MKRHNLIRKRSRLFLLSPLLIVIVITGLILLQSNKPNSANHHASQKALLQLPALINFISSNLLSRYSTLELGSAAEQNNNTGYPLSGYNFRVILPQSSSSLTFNDKRTTSESATYSYFSSTLTNINVILRNQSFKMKQPLPQDKSILSSTYFYQSSHDLCQVTIFTVLDINCSSSKVIETAAEQAKPLVADYLQDNPYARETTLSVAIPTLDASETKGYNLASIDIFSSNGETKANYYKQTKGDWQLVNLNWYNDPEQDANIIPNCEDFESMPDIKAAYLGHTCYDSVLQRDSVIQ